MRKGEMKRWESGKMGKLGKGKWKYGKMEGWEMEIWENGKMGK